MIDRYILLCLEQTNDRRGGRVEWTPRFQMTCHLAICPSFSGMCLLGHMTLYCKTNLLWILCLCWNC